jgi:spermidine/putrescine transport system substrate-binding protein
MTGIYGMPDRRSILKGLGCAAVGLTFSESKASALAEGEGNQLSFYNWDTYVGENTLEDFEASSGIKVKMDLFDTNDTLFAKLKAKNRYDLVVPTNDFVERMIAANMLQPLDHSLIPNFKNIGKRFRDPVYDPGCAHSMPYTALVLGIGYRKSKVKTRPTSWKPLFDSAEYRGRIALLAEPVTMFQLYAKYLGKSANSLMPEDIAAIEELMLRQKTFVKKFHNDDGQDLLIKGEVDLVVEYNGDVAQAIAEDPDLDFVVPDEGSLLMVDCLCIPKWSKRPKNAHRFINYMLGGAAGRHIAETLLYPTPNYSARAMMPTEYKNSHVLYPPPAKMARSEMPRYRPELQGLIEEAFTRIRAA